MTEDIAVPKTSETITVTRGAAYLLEGIIQDPRPCDSPIKIAKWARLYGAVRKANCRDVTVDGVKYDFEKGRNKIILAAGDTADATVKRKLEASLFDFEEACEAWRGEMLVLVLTRKNLETAKAAVEYRAKNQDLTKGLVFPINEHSLSLISELNLDDAE